MEFVQRCAAAAGFDVADPGLVVDERGMQHLVLVHPGRGLAARFPRTWQRCGLLPDAAARLHFLNRHGLPVPKVLAVHPDGGPGVAHLLLCFLSGAPLDEARTDDLPAASQRRLVAELIEVTEAVRRVPAEQWPSPAPDWHALWAGLVATVEGCSGLPPRVRRTQLDLVQRAAETAAAADIGVFHGDLGGVNCRIDPVSGAVRGLLDWDSAAVGDVTTDLVALLAGVGPRTAAHLRRSCQRWGAADASYAPYVATWPIQHYLWAERQGDPALRSAALASLMMPTASATR